MRNALNNIFHLPTYLGLQFNIKYACAVNLLTPKILQFQQFVDLYANELQFLI